MCAESSGFFSHAGDSEQGFRASRLRNYLKADPRIEPPFRDSARCPAGRSGDRPILLFSFRMTHFHEQTSHGERAARFVLRYTKRILYRRNLAIIRNNSVQLWVFCSVFFILSHNTPHIRSRYATLRFHPQAPVRPLSYHKALRCPSRCRRSTGDYAFCFRNCCSFTSGSPRIHRMHRNLESRSLCRHPVQLSRARVHEPGGCACA